MRSCKFLLKALILRTLSQLNLNIAKIRNFQEAFKNVDKNEENFSTRLLARFLIKTCTFEKVTQQLS